MQYYRPGNDLFVGDCMPFYHEGTFHLYYLRDENHHQALGGLGGHQWAHASTTDLIHWTHHPLAIAITDEREGSICTGSVFFYEGVYYAFYATRMRDRTQHLSLAISHDGIHFQKTEPNPFASPPAGYSPFDYRDPVVFQDPASGHFHLLATARLEPYALAGRGGCLARLTSPDLRQWELVEPFLVPGYRGVPECPDHFAWNGWYYLLFSIGGVAHYRLSRHPLGPWQCPPVDTFDGGAERVIKTAGFSGDRRLGVAFLGTRRDNRDDAPLQYAGHTVFRELIQRADGTLSTCFPQEMVPPTGEMLAPPCLPLTAQAEIDGPCVRLNAHEGMQVAALTDLPRDLHLALRVSPRPGAARYGLRLRGQGAFEGGYELVFSPVERTVRLHDTLLAAVDGLDRPFGLEIILHDEIIDVCIAGRRTMVNRLPQCHGDRLFFFAQDAVVTFDMVEVRPLLAPPGRVTGPR